MAAIPYGAPVRRTRSAIRAALAVALAALVVLGVTRIPDLLPAIPNPFTSRTVDRSEPAVLRALDDVSEYRAATASYSVIVDVERDAKWLPAFVRGERTVFVAAGRVDAAVELGGLDADAVVVRGGTVSVTLPEPSLAEPHLDPARSRVVSRDRGLLDRLGSVFADTPTGEQRLYLRAERKLASAAAADDALVVRAERNTRRMLERLLAPLGFDDVRVTFVTAEPTR